MAICFIYKSCHVLTYLYVVVCCFFFFWGTFQTEPSKLFCHSRRESKHSVFSWESWSVLSHLFPCTSENTAAENDRIRVTREERGRETKSWWSHRDCKVETGNLNYTWSQKHQSAEPSDSLQLSVSVQIHRWEWMWWWWRWWWESHYATEAQHRISVIRAASC